MGYHELFCELRRFFYELLYDIGGIVRDIFQDMGAVVEGSRGMDLLHRGEDKADVGVGDGALVGVVDVFQVRGVRVGVTEE